ncbi:MAG: hypothetical protein FDZ75_03700 [Actinobacteria bacterium]|nr:MAG: hypothetical protein FDZ75_03700 [Actinomycetota bacterium]
MDYYNDDLSMYALVRDLFTASAITCFLFACHRIARGLILQGQVRAYEQMAEAYTPEEREVLIHRIKHESMRF